MFEEFLDQSADFVFETCSIYIVQKLVKLHDSGFFVHPLLVELNKNFKVDEGQYFVESTFEAAVAVN